MAAGSKRRVFVVGGTGTIGQAVVQQLVASGHETVCLVRDKPGTARKAGAIYRIGNVRDPRSVREDGLAGERFDAVFSCLTSRTGAPDDAWAIDHQANVNVLEAAQQAGVGHYVLLSAICVQKPKLAFQHAKLAFENVLMKSGLTYSIVRPTAFFKSLCGQVDRLKAGKPFLVFGDGRLTACKPISDADTADYVVGCLDNANRYNRVLPVGGPGKAITPLEQGGELFRLLGMPPRYRHVPVAMLSAVIAGLSLSGRLSPRLAEKAELARIGRYYATESMLVYDPDRGTYDADNTPSHGTETLFDFYARLVRGEVAIDRGDHAVF